MAASWTPRSGEIVGGRYRLLTHLGAGSMGTVFRAEHVSLGSKAAVKVIDPQLVDRVGAEELAELEQRFLREAKAAAALDSAHVVRVLDYGMERGSPYIAMELLEGEALSECMDREGVLSPSFTCQIMSEVGKAIAKGHAAGIIHRDLKPENIFLARVDDAIVAKVLDFGIAKLAKNPHDTGRSTRRGELIGTPAYMSPEQIVGNHTVDAQADIWALAVIAFECLTGRLPFEAASVGGLALEICGPTRPKPSAVAPVPPGFDGWWERASKREPSERFANVREAIEALRGALGAPTSTRGAIPAPPVSSPSYDGPSSSQREHRAVVGADPSGVRSTQQTMATPLRQGVKPGLLWLGLLLGVGGAGFAAWLVLRGAHPTTASTTPAVATAQRVGETASSTISSAEAASATPNVSVGDAAPTAAASEALSASAAPSTSAAPSASGARSGEPASTAPRGLPPVKQVHRPKADPRLGL